MSDQIERALRRLGVQLPGRVSLPGEDGYAAATAIWAKPVGPMPRAVVHCRTTEDVQLAIRTARDCGVPLSVRGGGHDWVGRALCAGIVIDLSGMNGVSVDADRRSAIISGGARAADVAAVTDPLHVAAVTGTCSAVGMAGLTLGGGYGPLIGRFGLALDNLLAAQVVLADGRVIVASRDNEEELFWALRGGGGNFGVVTAMRHRLHRLPSVQTGLLVYPFPEAKAVLRRCADIAASSPEDLTVEFACVGGPDGKPVVIVHPTWSGLPADGEARVAPFLKLGTLLAGNLEAMSYGTSLTLYDPYIVNGQRVFMDTCWLPALDSAGIAAFIEAMAAAVSPGCALFTHEFKGASRVPAEATAFGLRRNHVVVEILATFVDRSDKEEEQRHRQWARATRHAFAPMALPGGYPNFLVADDAERVAKSYGPNTERLIAAKRHYDPDNIFNSAIPSQSGFELNMTSLPAVHNTNPRVFMFLGVRMKILLASADKPSPQPKCVPMYERLSIGIGKILACALSVLMLAQGSHAKAGTLLSPTPPYNSRVVRLLYASQRERSHMVVTALSPVGAPHIDVYVSDRTDASFRRIGAIVDPEFRSGLCCGTLYELPQQVGALPKGTLLWSGSVGQKPKPRRMAIKIYRSQDEGRSWSYLSEIRSPNEGGLWEPEFTVGREIAASARHAAVSALKAAA